MKTLPHGQIKHMYSRALYRVACKMFPVWQRIGLHVVNNDYYGPIPDTSTLDDGLWKKNSELFGIGMREEEMLELLARFMSRFKQEYDGLPEAPTKVPYQFHMRNGFYESPDAEVLYSMVRYHRPKRVYEIGSGFSTYLSAMALRKNAAEDAYEPELLAIEPYPGDALRAGFPGLTRLIAGRVQDVPVAEFKKLEENDILFIDSSHVLKMGSDVQYEYLEILPRLNKGVLVHIHDIFLPAEYPKRWVFDKGRFWNEQYLLQAFLALNDSYEVVWAGRLMHLKYPDRLEKAFRAYKRSGERSEQWPSSFWMRRIK